MRKPVSRNDVEADKFQGAAKKTLSSSEPIIKWNSDHFQPINRAMAKKVHSRLRYVLLLMGLVIAILLVPALIPRAYPAIVAPLGHYHPWGCEWMAFAPGGKEQTTMATTVDH